ncbi:hypothetical protein CEP51_015485 [Fusarium floridanum]|uniref:Uncharacterized protein n=1 Tax=Fusarium floridanum TaxID=1325733 RepID=A0A428P8W4_9HYPO|nr:hypothetical protein CEP51_015485 [Fusarium floridanum]
MPEEVVGKSESLKIGFYETVASVESRKEPGLGSTQERQVHQQGSPIRNVGTEDGANLGLPVHVARYAQTAPKSSLLDKRRSDPRGEHSIIRLSSEQTTLHGTPGVNTLLMTPNATGLGITQNTNH